MKDFHCHLLPGLDDGAQTLSETEAMLKRAASSGIDTIAATSHYSPTGEAGYEEAWAKTHELADRYSVKLLKGTEYDLATIPGIPSEKLRTIGDSGFLLVDMNCDYIVHSMLNLFCELKLAGLRIIFAHPERMLPPGELQKLLDMLEDDFIFIQADTGSVTGRYGGLARRNVFAMMDRGSCHFLWNDAHRDSHFLFAECRTILEKRYGEGVFELLTEKNPNAMLSGSEIVSMPPRKNFWERLFHRK